MKIRIESYDIGKLDTKTYERIENTLDMHSMMQSKSQGTSQFYMPGGKITLELKLKNLGGEYVLNVKRTSFFMPKNVKKIIDSLVDPVFGGKSEESAEFEADPSGSLDRIMNKTRYPYQPVKGFIEKEKDFQFPKPI